MNVTKSVTRTNAEAPIAAKAYAPLEGSSALDKVLALGAVRIVHEGTAIHRAGDELRSLYFVKTGVAKRVLLQEDGREQILGFPLPGELLGLEAIGGEHHSTTVMALDLCAIVEIPFRDLERLMARDPEVARTFYRLIAAALREEHGWLAALGLLTAEERVAAFLLDLSRRYAERGYSGTRFLLRMTRAEIGGFLGLTLETVSRIFSRLQRDEILSVDRREIAILDTAALSALSALGSTRIVH